MAKNDKNTTEPTKRGYRPLEEGYQPENSAQTSQSGQSAQQQPKPPAGGTGQSASQKESGDNA